MKYFDLGAAGVAIVGLIASLSSAFGPNQPSGAIFNCERVDRGGYFTFADPTCPEQFRDLTPNDPVEDDETEELG